MSFGNLFHDCHCSTHAFSLIEDNAPVAVDYRSFWMFAFTWNTRSTVDGYCREHLRTDATKNGCITILPRCINLTVPVWKSFFHAWLYPNCTGTFTWHILKLCFSWFLKFHSNNNQIISCGTWISVSKAKAVKYTFTWPHPICSPRADLFHAMV